MCVAKLWKSQNLTQKWLDSFYYRWISTLKKIVLKQGVKLPYEKRTILYLEQHAFVRLLSSIFCCKYVISSSKIAKKVAKNGAMFCKNEHFFAYGSFSPLFVHKNSTKPSRLQKFLRFQTQSKKKILFCYLQIQPKNSPGYSIRNFVSRLLMYNKIFLDKLL